MIVSPTRQADTDTTTTTTTTTKSNINILDSLKGLDFQQWNDRIGLPTKHNVEQPIFPYEWTVFNTLMQEDGSPKDRHVAWLASRGLGKTTLATRILSFLCTRDDNLRDSEMQVITGNRQALANSIIKKFKVLFKDAYLEDTAADTVVINGVTIVAYPASGHSSSSRGKSNVSAIFLDESSWWNENEIEEILDSIIGYWVKSNPYTLLASTPSTPSDLMSRIWREQEDETAWRRIRMDYTYGENLIYTQKDLDRIRKTSSWQREMLLRWSPRAGSTFLPGDVERAKCIYDLNPLGTERTIAVDAAANITGICVVEERDGDIYVLKAEEKVRATHESLSEYVYELWHDYEPISKLFIDNASVTFVKTMKDILGEPVEYMDQIRQYKAAHAKYELNMRVEPVFFTLSNKQEMLGLLKQCLQEGHLKIHEQEHTKLLSFLYGCNDTELVIDSKSSIPANDIGDAIQMCMRNYTK